MKVLVLVLLLSGGLLAGCGDGGSSGQQAQNSLMESDPMEPDPMMTMTPGGPMMGGAPMMQTTPRMTR